LSGGPGARYGPAPGRHGLHRIRICTRDRWRCGICGGRIDPDLSPFVSDMAGSVDHVWPRWAGGGHDDGNLQAAHLRCNLAKGRRLRFEMAA